PQQAIQRTADGRSSLIVVREGKAITVPVSTGVIIDGQTLITKGLAAGDQVVVEGFQKIRPGAPVQPMPWKPGAPAAGQSAAQAQQGGQPGAAPEDNGAQAAPADAKPAAKPAEQG